MHGLFQLIEKRKAAGALGELAGEDGQIHCVSLCCDLPYQYIDEYFDKLGPEPFPAIRNSVSLQTFKQWHAPGARELPKLMQRFRS